MSEKNSDRKDAYHENQSKISDYGIRVAQQCLDGSMSPVIYNQDIGRCQECHRYESDDVTLEHHHIKYVPEITVQLCQSCHVKVSAADNHELSAKQTLTEMFKPAADVPLVDDDAVVTATYCHPSKNTLCRWQFHSDEKGKAETQKLCLLEEAYKCKWYVGPDKDDSE
jgi:hypothetical protein